MTLRIDSVEEYLHRRPVLAARSRRAGLRGRLRARLQRYASRTSPWLLLRFLAATLVLAPVWIVVLLVSLYKRHAWRQPTLCWQLIRRYPLAFPALDLDTLRIEPVCGGISNSTYLWHCADSDGTPHHYFVKVFLPVGTLWAFVCPIVGPLPTIYGHRSGERFTVDMVTRTQLAARGIPVAQLIVYDPVQYVMVSERLDGVMVTDILERLKGAPAVTAEAGEILRQCGAGLGRIHAAGFSLIDAQPANCMWVPQRRQVYFLDFEYCTREDKQVWDVGFFLAMLAAQFEGALAPPLRGAGLGRAAQHEFVVGYREHQPVTTQAVSQRDALLREYLPVFRAILDLRQFTPEELFGELTGGASPET